MLPPREYLIEEYTRTVCPTCFEEGPRRSDDAGTFVDGMLVSHGGSVWLRRFCARHGETESLYEEDLDIWRSRAGWSTPTLQEWFRIWSLADRHTLAWGGAALVTWVPVGPDRPF